jgi:hypothetical protein
MARTFIEKFLGQPLLGEKVREGERGGERRERKIMVLIEATTFSTSVCNANRWRTHFARTNNSDASWREDRKRRRIVVGHCKERKRAEWVEYSVCQND